MSRKPEAMRVQPVSDSASRRPAPEQPTLLLTEVLAGGGLSFAQVARRLPPSRRGRPVAPSTVWRWACQGVRTPHGERIRLETVRVAGRTLTTESALLRFLAAQQPAAALGPAEPPPLTPGQRHTAAQRAAEELDVLGI
jgi:hypothetical protein